MKSIKCQRESKNDKVTRRHNEGGSMREKLKSVRINKKYTQENLAAQIPISRTHYSKIENGVRNPSYTVAIKIKEVLNYTKDDLF